jgi:formylmethanofuran dehydrogenase subunit E
MNIRSGISQQHFGDATPNVDAKTKTQALVPTAYFSDQTSSLSASLFCAFYADALKRSKHDVAFDAAFYHQKSMLGENAISVEDAKLIIESYAANDSQVLRCSKCNATFFSSRLNPERTTCPSDCLA